MQKYASGTKVAFLDHSLSLWRTGVVRSYTKSGNYIVVPESGPYPFGQWVHERDISLDISKSGLTIRPRMINAIEDIGDRVNERRAGARKEALLMISETLEAQDWEDRYGRLLNTGVKTAAIPSMEELSPHRYDSECYEVAAAVQRQWPELEADSGFYVHPSRGAGDHAWNVAPDGTIVDMTAKQHDYEGPKENWDEVSAPLHPEMITFIGYGTMYHVSPRGARESILHHGLDSNRKIVDLPYVTTQRGNYLAVDWESARAFADLALDEGMSAVDYWLVDVNGLTLIVDPNDAVAQEIGLNEEDAWWVYTEDPIPSERLQLIDSRMGTFLIEDTTTKRTNTSPSNALPTPHPLVRSPHAHIAQTPANVKVNPIVERTHTTLTLAGVIDRMNKMSKVGARTADRMWQNKGLEIIEIFTPIISSTPFQAQPVPPEWITWWQANGVETEDAGMALYVGHPDLFTLVQLLPAFHQQFGDQVRSYRLWGTGSVGGGGRGPVALNWDWPSSAYNAEPETWEEGYARLEAEAMRAVDPDEIAKAEQEQLDREQMLADLRARQEEHERAMAEVAANLPAARDARVWLFGIYDSRGGTVAVEGLNEMDAMQTAALHLGFDLDEGIGGVGDHRPAMEELRASGLLPGIQEVMEEGAGHAVSYGAVQAEDGSFVLTGPLPNEACDLEGDLGGVVLVTPPGLTFHPPGSEEQLYVEQLDKENDEAYNSGDEMVDHPNHPRWDDDAFSFYFIPVGSTYDTPNEVPVDWTGSPNPSPVLAKTSNWAQGTRLRYIGGPDRAAQPGDLGTYRGYDTLGLQDYSVDLVEPRTKFVTCSYFTLENLLENWTPEGEEEDTSQDEAGDLTFPQQWVRQPVTAATGLSKGDLMRSTNKMCQLIYADTKGYDRAEHTGWFDSNFEPWDQPPRPGAQTRGPRPEGEGLAARSWDLVDALSKLPPVQTPPQVERAIYQAVEAFTYSYFEDGVDVLRKAGLSEQEIGVVLKEWQQYFAEFPHEIDKGWGMTTDLRRPEYTPIEHPDFMPILAENIWADKTSHHKQATMIDSSPLGDEPGVVKFPEHWAKVAQDMSPPPCPDLGQIVSVFEVRPVALPVPMNSSPRMGEPTSTPSQTFAKIHKSNDGCPYPDLGKLIAEYEINPTSLPIAQGAPISMLARLAQIGEDVPMYTEPIVAKRFWGVLDDGTLTSAWWHKTVWPGFAPLEAVCPYQNETKIRDWFADRSSEAGFEHYVQDPQSGPPPHYHRDNENVFSYGCGIYALKPGANGPGAQIPGNTKSRMNVWGQVSLWGRVLEYDLGYRAQYAYPYSISWAGDDPTGVKDKIRAKYGIDVEQAPGWGDYHRDDYNYA